MFVDELEGGQLPQDRGRGGSTADDGDEDGDQDYLRVSRRLVNEGLLQTLLGEGEVLLESWYRAFLLCRSSDRLSRSQFQEVFGQELRELHRGDAQDHVLESSGTNARRWGIPLEELMVATKSFEGAAIELVGPPAPELQRALRDLELARVTAYARSYVRGSRLDCSRRSNQARPVRRFGLVGSSPAMELLLQRVRLAAGGHSHVLVTGDTGVGKSLVARAIHEASGSKGPYVVVDCASLPLDIAELELFGCESGAFGGSGRARTGLIRAARGGTLHLEDFTEMPLPVQAKLRRFLEEREVRPLGSLEGQAVDVRVVATTSRDLDQAVAEGTLREDLRFRLQAVRVEVPELAERLEDIPELAEWFLTSFCNRHCDCIRGISEEAMEVLQTARWPGNVRQLKNTLEHAVLQGTHPMIQVEDLPSEARRPVPAARTMTLAEAEAELVRQTLERFQGNKAQCAKALGISRHKLYSVLKRIDA